MTNPVTYQVRDLNNEKILGSFYTRELSPAKQNIFRIEKVIKRKNKKALVKWVGYSGKHNSWVLFSDLIDTVATPIFLSQTAFSYRFRIVSFYAVSNAV